VNYDCDAILPLESYELAYKGILDGIYDVVYPYASGNYQYQVEQSDKVVSHFLETTDYEYLKSHSKVHDAQYGHVQFFNRDVYIKGGMENENFKAYAPEDKERFYRFTKLGYSVGRISNYIYHLEHSRGENSWFSNPHMNSNMSEWDKIQKLTKEELIEYYSVQSYLKKYQ
jgi:predicted glycosyltransferase involved in capsule biosynthesis